MSTGFLSSCTSGYLDGSLASNFKGHKMCILKQSTLLSQTNTY